MKKRMVLYADDGMILTDGDTYGRIVYLSPEKDASAYREIPEEEYEAILAAEEERFAGGESNEA